MTDYGRGSGSEPWHPQDPLYGDQGWAAQQADDGVPQGGGPQQQYDQYDQYGTYAQHDPQGPYAQPGQYGPQQEPYGQGYDPYQQQYPQGSGQYPQHDFGSGQYPQYPGEQNTQQGYPAQQEGQVPGPRYDGPGPGQGQGYDPGYGQQAAQQHPQQGYVQQSAGVGHPGQGVGHPGQGGGHPGQGGGPYPQGQGPGFDPAYGGAWDTGAQQTVGYQQQPGGYGPSGQEEYGAPAGQQQPPAPQRPQAARLPQQTRGSRQEPPHSDWGWDDEPPQETHPFFTGEDTPLPGSGRTRRGGKGRSRDADAASDDGHSTDNAAAAGGDDDDAYPYDPDDPDGPDDPGHPRKGKKRKGRSGAACLIIAVVLIGGVGGLGYYGYTLYQDHFGPPPDYAGSGAGAVQITVPDGANGTDIASLLVKNGVIRSTGAFVVAQDANPKGNTIQAGVYTLKKQMSGKSAVALMLSPKSRSALIIPEGTRDAAVYALIDKRLKLKAGTTKSVASAQLTHLGLPDWADDAEHIKDPLEGFLFPASYPVADKSEPEDVLKAMVARANAEYGKYGLETKAKSVGLDNPWQLLTVASLVQAEGKTHDDFRKMAEVVYNRLKTTNRDTNRLLQFDSTYNYLKGQSHIHITVAEVNSNHDPYNTYTNKGLPPGPIGNPGEDALAAAINPTHDGWLYFVATDGDNRTEFAKTFTGFEQLKQKFDSK